MQELDFHVLGPNMRVVVCRLCDWAASQAMITAWSDCQQAKGSRIFLCGVRDNSCRVWSPAPIPEVLQPKLQGKHAFLMRGGCHDPDPLYSPAAFGKLLDSSSQDIDERFSKHHSTLALHDPDPQESIVA